jgi:hypothetical protein
MLGISPYRFRRLVVSGAIPAARSAPRGPFNPGAFQVHRADVELYRDGGLSATAAAASVSQKVDIVALLRGVRDVIDRLLPPEDPPAWPQGRG